MVTGATRWLDCNDANVSVLSAEEEEELFRYSNAFDDPIGTFVNSCDE
jgi:hypothetical protein